MKRIIPIILLFATLHAKAQISQNTKPVENTQQKYIPLPMDDITKEAIRANNAAVASRQVSIANFLEYYNSIKSFKAISNGVHKVKVIMATTEIFNCEVSVIDNKVTAIGLNKVYNSENGLKVNSTITNGHCKVYLDDSGMFIPIEVYILDSFE